MPANKGQRVSGPWTSWGRLGRARTESRSDKWTFHTLADTHPSAATWAASARSSDLAHTSSPPPRELFYPSGARSGQKGACKEFFSIELRGRPFPSGWWRLLSPSETLTRERASGQRKAFARRTKGNSGPGRMLCSAVPHSAGSRALSLEQVARFWALRGSVLRKVHKASLPRGQAPGLASTPPKVRHIPAILPPSGT